MSLANKTYPLKNRWAWLIFCSFILSIAYVPTVVGPGLNSNAPVDVYLNGAFPSVAPVLNETVTVTSAFPAITFNSPLTWAMHPTQDIVFVGQRDGAIYYFDQNNPTSKTLFLDHSSNVGVVWDGGFLGMALHPNFGQANQTGRNYFYTYYSTRDGSGGHEPVSAGPQPCIDGAANYGGFLILSRWSVQEGTLNVVPNSEEIMFRVRLYNTTHRGGGMLFGQDGFLYLTTGDQAQHNPAQTMDTNLDGGVLRIDVNQDPTKSHEATRMMPQDPRGPDEISGQHYWIPNDNPFLSPDGSRFEEYYTIGHRNPHRMTMDPVTGMMYIGEIGSNQHEEINVVQAGANYGWPVFEGFDPKNRCVTELYPGTTHQNPLVSFPRSEANSITGGYVYRGTEIPSLYGKYICGDYGNGEEIWAVDTQTGNYEFLLEFQPDNIISFGQDHQGEVYILKQGNNTTLYKLSLVGGAGQQVPATLSQTGAFSDLASLTPAPGVIPYDLVEPFWSDKALKKRWLMIPNGNDGSHDGTSEKIQFDENGDWNFPVGTVLIKHFEILLDETNPNSAKRLETRFSIKGANGNFYFVTYKWRPDHSDADLLETGMTETLTIQEQGGSSRTQVWNYPSRTDCSTCHNDATGGTLGLRTRYLNKNLVYTNGGVPSNQLVTLSHIGILDQAIDDATASGYVTAAAMDDPSATLEHRARSYLDLNCAYCHRPDTENRAVFDARLSTPLEQTNLFSSQLNEPLGIEGERIVFPQDPSKSALYIRHGSVDQSIMMPPLAKDQIDEEGQALLSNWINSLDPNLIPEDRGLKGTYFNNLDFTNQALIRLDPQVDFEWGSGSPDNSIGSNTFSVIWEGEIEADFSEAYTFYTRTDDGVRLWVNNQLLIDKWVNQSPTEWSGNLVMTAGERVPIRMEFYENSGGAVAQLSWSSSSVNKQIIPTSNLYAGNQRPTADVTISTSLQGRTDHSGTFSLKMYDPSGSNLFREYTEIANLSGDMYIPEIAPGNYMASLKHDQFLENRKMVTIVEGSNTINMEELKAGDCNNDNFVTALDFSILAISFNQSVGQPTFDPRADFNKDDFVTALDFSLLASNFNSSGGGLLSAVPSPNIVQQVDLTLKVPNAPIPPSSTFVASIYAETGNQPIDAVEAHLKYDNRGLEVADIRFTRALDIELQKKVTHGQGEISLAAGRLQGSLPSGKVKIADILFKSAAPGPASIEFANQGIASDVTYRGQSILGQLSDGSVFVELPTISGVVLEEKANANPLNVDLCGEETPTQVNQMYLDAYYMQLGLEREHPESKLSNSWVKASPNPIASNQQLTLQTYWPTQEDVLIEVFDQIGHLIRVQPWALQQKNDQVELSIKDLIPGIYLIRVSGTDLQHSLKIIVQ